MLLKSDLSAFGSLNTLHLSFNIELGYSYSTSSFLLKSPMMTLPSSVSSNPPLEGRNIVCSLIACTQRWFCCRNSCFQQNAASTCSHFPRFPRILKPNRFSLLAHSAHKVKRSPFLAPNCRLNVSPRAKGRIGDCMAKPMLHDKTHTAWQKSCSMSFAMPWHYPWMHGKTHVCYALAYPWLLPCSDQILLSFWKLDLYCHVIMFNYV